MLVPIILGSKSDSDHAKKITDQLDKWEIPYKIHVASAHKVPEMVLDIVKGYNDMVDETICYVTIAGRSNGLSGVTAANSVHPVIACPPYKNKDDMNTNINSTLQMPSDTPVLTVVDAQNAVMSVIRILATSNIELRARVAKHIQNVKDNFKS